MNELLLVAKRIRLCREEFGLSQCELANLLNVASSSVNSWEAGENLPGITNIIGLSILFGVSSDFILGMKQNANLNVDDLNTEEISALSNLIDCFKKK